MPRIRHVTVMIGKVENVPSQRFARRICPGCNTEHSITQNNKFIRHSNGTIECNASRLTTEQYNKLWSEVIQARKSTFR